jgi:uncharacterized protein DUF3221
MILKQQGQTVLTRGRVTFADFQTGQEVQVQFDGSVATSIPPQIHAQEVIILT